MWMACLSCMVGPSLVITLALVQAVMLVPLVLLVLVV